MKIIIQRVKKARVSIEGQVQGKINQGLLLLVGVGPEDHEEDLDYAVRKLVNMRIFSGAAKPDMASDFYDVFNQKLAQEVPVQTGIFGADMQVELVNDGPVTIILDTKNR